MVKIELKGTEEEDGFNGRPYKHNIPIATFRAGVYLEDRGTVVIQLSSKKLTKEFQKVFKKASE